MNGSWRSFDSQKFDSRVIKMRARSLGLAFAALLVLGRPVPGHAQDAASKPAATPSTAAPTDAPASVARPAIAPRTAEPAPATTEEVNGALKSAASGSLKGILEYTEDPVVSSDLMHNASSAVVDGQLTKVLDGNLAKVVAWYDNEWGYSMRIVDLIEFLAKKGL